MNFLAKSVLTNSKFLRRKMADGERTESPWPMISIEEANRISLMHTEPLSAVAVPLAQSLVAPLPPLCSRWRT
jgi:hypothetical protein